MERSARSKASRPGSINPAELELLSQSFLFAGLPRRRLLTALKSCQCFRLQKKKIVYRRGEPGNEMCIVLSGGVKVSAQSADGKEIIFDLLSAGDFFGELSLLDGGPRTATVTTLVPSVLAVLDRNCFMPFLEANPMTAVRLLHILAHRLRSTDTFLEEVLFFDSETRLAKRVMALEDIYGKAEGKDIQIELNVSQQDIASLVGITRETANKLLKKWEREKIVSLQQGRLTILNSPHLHKLASEAGRFNLLKV